jgi:hypothetical protein
MSNLRSRRVVRLPYQPEQAVATPDTKRNKSIFGCSVKLTEFVMKTAKELSAGERDADTV